MKSISNLNSICLIIGISAILGCLLSACGQKQSAQAELTEQSPSASSGSSTPKNGRYIILFSPQVRADTFLLDTQKGKVWQLTKYSDMTGEPTVWDQMTIIDNAGEVPVIPGSITYQDFLKLYQPKDAGKKSSK